MYGQCTSGRTHLVMIIILVMLGISCKKESTPPPQTSTQAITPPIISTTIPGPVVLGLTEFAVDTNKRLFIRIAGIGTQTVAYNGIFDTGSTGMTMDAHGIIPSSMITSTGIQFSGDSITVNGITITSQTAVFTYGGIGGGLTKEYGNLAYARITVGNGNDTLSIKRVPFFLYYKVIDGNGTQLGAHTYDTFGVGPGVNYIIGAIASPLSYFNAGPNTTSGFKLATLNDAFFNSTGGLVAGLLTVGLTANDLTSSGFIIHPLTAAAVVGYSPDIPATVTYDNKNVSTEVLFDTGLASLSIIEDKTAVQSIGELPPNTIVKITTNKGFVYQYTTSAAANLTTVQNPNNTGDIRTIISIDFFISNEYLLDYSGHQIGLKNN